MGIRERITADAQDPFHKLKKAGREYFDNPDNQVSPEFRQVICDANGFLELLYYSKKFPDHQDWLHARTFELARKRLSQDQVEDAFKRAKEFYDDWNNPEKRKPRPQASHQAKEPYHLPKKASIDTSGIEADRINQSFNHYFTSPFRESLKRNLGEHRYQNLQEKVSRFIDQRCITQDECGEFSLQNITRIGREIVNQARGNPPVFQTVFIKPTKPS